MVQFALYPLNLRLFDGAAGTAGAAAGAEGGENTASGESKTLPVAAGRGNRAKNPLADVVYGKQESGNASENAETPPAEEKSQAAADKPTTKTTSDALEAKKAEFEKLIQGEYKDLFSERMQGIIDRRFKETKNLKAQVDGTQPLLDMLAAKYGVSDGDVQQLSKAIREDDSYYEKEAADKGMTVEQLKYIRQKEQENATLKRSLDEMQNRRNADKIYSGWMQEAEGMKAVYPKFDLSAEIEGHPEFLKMLRLGVNMKTAYQALHMDEVMGGAMQYTAQKVQEQTVNSIKARGNRPVENGLSSQTGVIVKNDVSKFSPADRKEIARRAARGEQISF